jgi:serine/threonine protein kinase
MGTVYKAQSKNDNQWYAVKVLPRRSMWNVRIARRQVRSFEQINHPAVVPFVDVGTSGSTHYLAWPLVEGNVLETVVQQQGKLAPDVAALYMLQTAEGLDACHDQDIIHGLLKPSNIMIGHDGQARILDFGIGSLLANTEGESLVDTMSTANSLTSGLDCASPECILEPSNRTPAGDQYSLGCVLYFCLTGQYPFSTGTAVDKMMAHQTKEPTPVNELAPEVPDALVKVVERLMKKSPQARYAHTLDVVEALRPLAAPTSPRSLRPMGLAVKPKPGSVKVPVHAGAPNEAAPAPEQPAGRVVTAGRDLPTRPSFHPNGAANHSPVPAAIPVQPAPRRQNPFLLEEPREPWLERLGPLGIIAGAVFAAGATWLLSMYLFR